MYPDPASSRRDKPGQTRTRTLSSESTHELLQSWFPLVPVSPDQALLVAIATERRPPPQTRASLCRGRSSVEGRQRL